MELAYEDASILKRAAELLILGRPDEARTVLRKLRNEDPVEAPVVLGRLPVRAGPRGGRTAPATRARVLERDGWRCQYCTRFLVHAHVLKLLGECCEEEFPFPSYNMPENGRTAKAAIRVCPEVDHLIPRSHGGGPEDENLRAACTPCNGRKKAQWNLEQKKVIDGHEWDGLVGVRAKLAEAAAKLSLAG